MDYKSLLIIVTAATNMERLVPAAAQLAQACDAHLTALALGVDRVQVGYTDIGSGGVMLGLGMDQAEEEAQNIEAALRDALRPFESGLRYSIDSTVILAGLFGETITQRARYADLVILSQPASDQVGTETESLIGAVVDEGMCPALILPASGPAVIEPKRIVLGWNQSREAMMAARLSLPFLKAAEQVVVTVIDPSTRGLEQSDPGVQMCRYLARHGVSADIHVLPKALPRIADSLLRQCQDVDADLLVMGSFGRSRLLQAILGGTTRDMIESMNLPVLMAG